MLAAVPLTALMLTSCSSYGGNDDRAETSVTCEDVLATVVHRERTGDTAGAINAELDWLGDNCPSEYQVFVDYVSTKGMAEQLGAEPCDTLTQYIGPEAIALLSEDGLCSGGAPGSLADLPAGEDQPGGGIAWDEAFNFAGTTQRVCGPFAGSGNSENDVFLNLGHDYPDPERFQILIWDIGAVEPIAIGATVCTSGQVELYNGVAEIVLEPTELDRVEVYG
jgi:hypothetical protein